MRHDVLWLAGFVLTGLACGGVTEEGHPPIGANEFFPASDSVPAGATGTYGWQAVDAADGSPASERIEVRFSVSSGTLSHLVDTTDEGGMAAVNWTVGGVTGSQAILAEFYYLDGVRSGGHGKEIVVVPGGVASIAFTHDTVVLFQGERLLLTDWVATAQDSFGNQRGIGEYAITGTAGIHLVQAGDSIEVDSAGVGGLVVHAGLAIDTLGIRAESRYLLDRPISFSFACWQSDTGRRGSDNALVGYELTVAGTITGVVFPTDSSYYPSLPGIMQLILDETKIYSWSDGVVDTLNPQQIQEVTRWRPDTIEYGAPGSSRDNGRGTRVGNNLVGGNWCNAQGASTHQHSPVLLTVH